MAGLLAYDWPGNVRELFHVLQRAAVLCGGEVIDVARSARSRAQRRDGGARPRAGRRRRTSRCATRSRALEKQLIERALERAKGNRSEAARLLGIARPQLYAKMEEHGIAAKGDTTDAAPND